MVAKSTSDRYGTVVVSLHWLSAVLIMALIGSGFRASGLEGAAVKTAILQVHVPLGVTVLLLTLARIACSTW